MAQHGTAEQSKAEQSMLCYVAKAFSLCSPPADVDAWVYWITEALESLPQIDYPEASGNPPVFPGLPASPVNATCATVGPAGSDDALLAALATVTGWFYGLAPGGCLKDAASDQVGGGTPGDGPSPGDSWGYQSCTETLHAFSTPSGAWRAYTYERANIDALCEKYYGLKPRVGWLATWGGGYQIADQKTSSNIIWSNGRRDPWHGGGFLRQEDALPGGAVFVMQETAHHQDLRAPVPGDPDELVEVRKKEEDLIRKWIADASRGGGAVGGASCEGSGDPKEGVACWMGEASVLGQTEQLLVQLNKYNATDQSQNDINIDAGGVASLSCHHRGFTKTGQDIKIEMNGGPPPRKSNMGALPGLRPRVFSPSDRRSSIARAGCGKGLEIESAKYCSDTDTIDIKVKDVVEISATLKRADPCPTR
jgi:hypothetical protein